MFFFYFKVLTAGFQKINKFLTVEGDIVFDYERICFLPINVKAIINSMIIENIIIHQIFLLLDKPSQTSSMGMFKVSLSLEML